LFIIAKLFDSFSIIVTFFGEDKLIVVAECRFDC